MDLVAAVNLNFCVPAHVSSNEPLFRLTVNEEGNYNLSPVWEHDLFILPIPRLQKLLESKLGNRNLCFTSLLTFPSILALNIMLSLIVVTINLKTTTLFSCQFTSVEDWRGRVIGKLFKEFPGYSLLSENARFAQVGIWLGEYIWVDGLPKLRVDNRAPL